MSPGRLLSMVSPEEAAAAVCDRLAAVGSERVAHAQLPGRVLAGPATADRDSPPADVSAMDGYALRAADAPPPGGDAWLPVAGEVRIGEAPPPLPTGAALRVFTGGAVPAGADAVVPRELLEEEAEPGGGRGGRIRWLAGSPAPVVGRHIRRRGENARAGDVVLPVGVEATPAVVATLAAFGAAPPVRRRVRVAIRVTGDELHAADAAVLPPLGIRDGNGPVMAAFVAGLPWAEVVSIERVPDDRDATTLSIASALEASDAVLLSGGVSMGDHDHVPAACVAAGCTPVYHRLAMRPGKPNFGAAGPAGQAVLGLPGNPVSVLAGLRVLTLPALRRLAGFAAPQPPRLRVAVAPDDAKTLPLWHYRPARIGFDGRAHPLAHRGSGDVAGPAAMHGFVEIPPGEAAEARPRRWFA
ncbi:molybdopterin molybdotransferase MoeA [Phycisphaera mikurensis]|uniref:Molybdopterin molybdenumtransferase n=1 Tax=Phycisphaera mikurensis (strain NBRC 102666 / KCTC 22515 / FYK2301M01) TaxID=1142394 RepID=I0IEF5_PHYMF|nr:molybdopterin molybdotransferase MoeA [Phycisphaera mikurensis]MBB6441442.1 molybdopterin molybdotransferase [Phycisphaera mikurensis]BAM03643.1 putative molybdopterin molybdenumtransferase [Phycisphaera mikurensis NBRC 102666]